MCCMVRVPQTNVLDLDIYDPSQRQFSTSASSLVLTQPLWTVLQRPSQHCRSDKWYYRKHSIKHNRLSAKDRWHNTSPSHDPVDTLVAVSWKSTCVLHTCEPYLESIQLFGQACKKGSLSCLCWPKNVLEGDLFFPHTMIPSQNNISRAYSGKQMGSGVW